MIAGWTGFYVFRAKYRTLWIDGQFFKRFNRVLDRP